MSAYAERRNIMDNFFMPPVSIEKFAAYLDGNLSDDEMNRIDVLVSTNPDMEKLVAVSDEVDEDIQVYMQDEFAYEADWTALEDTDFDIPNLESDLSTHIGTDTPNYKEVACAACAADAAHAADGITDIDETNQLNGDDDEIGEDEFGNDEFMTHQDDDSFSTINENDGGNAHETSNFPIEDDFFE